MQTTLTQRAKLLVRSLHDPFSQSVIPLFDGLTRNFLLRQGVEAQEHRICGIRINLYTSPSRTTPLQKVPLLLIHGLADNALTWALQMLPLSRIGPVYALDLPGFGLSSCPRGQCYANLTDFDAVLRTLIADVIGQPPLVIGNSLGGWLAVRLAWAAPHLVRGVVLLNPGGAILAGRASWQPFIDNVKALHLGSARQICHQMFGVVPPLLYMGQRSFQTLFTRDPVHQFVATVDGTDLLTPDDLRNLPTTSGLIWGLADTFLPAGSLEFFRDNMPHALLMELPGCGHLPQRERPRSVVRFVRAFAQNLELSPPHVQAAAVYHTL